MVEVESSSSVLFTSCTLTKNSATYYGGVAWVKDSASVTFNSCTLTKNSSPGVSYPVLYYFFYF